MTVSDFTRLKQYLDGLEDLERVEQLCGDASSREYYRIIFKDGSRKIIQFDSNLTKKSSFIEWSRFLKSKGILVPDLTAVDFESQLVEMQDLGTIDYEKYHQKNGLLAQDIENIVGILKKLLSLSSVVKSDNPCFSLSFDAQKYLDEFLFFEKHYVQGRLRLSLSDIQKEFFKTYSKDIEKYSKYWVHRDFHSRNIMVHDDQFYIIDYQDARLGSRFYDLISFMYDPYIRLSEDNRVKLLTSFKNQIEIFDPKEFDLILWQRLVKILGSYTYLEKTKNNRSYKEYILPTLKHIVEIQNKNNYWPAMNSFFIEALKKEKGIT